MNQFLLRLRRANSVLSGALDAAVRSLHVHRRTQLVALVATAALAAVAIFSVVHRASSSAGRWATGVPVIVSAGPLAAGDPVSAANTRTVTLPAAIAPADALGAPPVGATVRLSLAAGTPITSSMLVADVSSPAVPDGWRIVAMPIDVAAPTIAPGDMVDVVAMDTVVAAGALVISAGDDSFGPTIAVPQEVAATVATTAGTGEASLVLAS